MFQNLAFAGRQRVDVHALFASYAKVTHYLDASKTIVACMSKGRTVRVPDEIQECVAFVYVKNGADDTLASFRQIGTAFLLGVVVSDGGASWSYLVTARHLIDLSRDESTDNSLYLRFNLKAGGTRMMKTPMDQWIVHETDAQLDAAILPFDQDEELEIRLINADFSCTTELTARHNIGTGTDVFLTGLFFKHYGEDRNIPIVRMGTIAAMPRETVRTAWGPMNAYLVEARSIGGLSGSPVFVHFTETTNFTLGSTTRVVFLLLGLMHGHWNIDVKTSKAEAASDASIAHAEAVNMGIGMVVPIDGILEMLDTRAELERRRAAYEEAVNSAKDPKSVPPLQVLERIRREPPHDSFPPKFDGKLYRIGP